MECEPRSYLQYLQFAELGQALESSGHDGAD